MNPSFIYIDDEGIARARIDLPTLFAAANEAQRYGARVFAEIVTGTLYAWIGPHRLTAACYSDLNLLISTVQTTRSHGFIPQPGEGEA